SRSRHASYSIAPGFAPAVLFSRGLHRILMRSRATSLHLRQRPAGSTTLVPRRFLTLVAGAALMAALAGCARKTGNAASQSPAAPAQPFRIGIMTGTTSLTGEDFRAGEEVVRRYPGRVMHVTYPDDYASEVETVIAQLAGLAADPKIRVIV